MSTATLSFDYKRGNLADASEYFAVEVSANGGGSWVELDRLAGPADDGQYLSASYDISAYTSFGTTIRFLGAPGLDNQDRLKVDFVQIEYTVDVIDVDIEQSVEDRFNTVSYGNNDGSVDWTGDWVEVGEADGPASGDLSVVNFNAQLRVRDNDVSIERQADLSGAISAQLSFDYKRAKLDDASDYIALEISADGGANWTELDRFAGPADDEVLQATAYDVTDFAAVDTKIRFRTSPTLGGTENLRVDNLKISYDDTPDTHYPTLIGADQLHAQGIDGTGVTIAVVDSGYFATEGLDKNAAGNSRVLAQYDAINDQMDPVGTSTDTYGHGTHLTSVALSSYKTSAGKYNGVAPGADLVSVKAFSNGQATYTDVIAGIDWVVDNQATYGIDVLNLSMAAAPLSYYWDDPLNQAVMAAWDAGIVVVASAGNFGPAPMTIGVPGNVPYVITVGAMSDNFTPADGSDDILASWSSAGPTVTGFIKPEVVAPGGHTLGLMALSSTIAQLRPEYQHAASYFTMSGTSQSAAVVSGIVALMLDNDPSLDPDDVKCKLLASARAALDENDDLAYSIFQQGVGMTHAYDAVYSTASGCANLALDISADLAGTAHYGGPARYNPTTGEFYHDDQAGFEWAGGWPFIEGGGWPFIEGGGWPFIEGGGWPFIEGGGWPFIEGGGWPFIEGSVNVNGLDWLDEYDWNNNPHVWSSGLTETMSVNQWVPQE